MKRRIRINDLMNDSGVKFGTSGARGLATDMRDAVCYAYTLGFLQHLRDTGMLAADGRVGIGGDLRPSTPRIMGACARATKDMGLSPLNCGLLPSPALAYYGIVNNMPTLMVTGSHIPDDRNGIKFNTPLGEILKSDEQAIRRQAVDLPVDPFDTEDRLSITDALSPPDPAATEAYVRRYLDFLPQGCLHGMRIGVYEHSGVARDLLKRILTGLGAEVSGLGRSERFIPVDTEAIRPEDVQLASAWAAGGNFDCLVSTDGDGDRPLVSNEHGEWLRGDIAGILCAHYLGAAAAVTPVSSNTTLERSGWFQHIVRTRIGSPYVIAGMQQALEQEHSPVIGYEANGGFLIATDIEREGRRLSALPTRDAVIVALCILLLARERGVPISGLSDDLPRRYTASDRIKEFPTQLSQERIAALGGDDFTRSKATIEAQFGEHFGRVADIDQTDGLRISFNNGDIAHLRPSGNAPELRAYTEGDTPERAERMIRICMQVLAGWR